MKHRVETPEHLKENKYTYVYVEYEDDIVGNYIVTEQKIML